MKALARRLSIFLVCSTFAIMAFPVHAQVLLSNIANATGGDYGGAPDSADHITTGNVGLSVNAINVLWESLGGTPGPNRVGVFTDDGGFASSTQIGSWFTNPADTIVGLMTYEGSAQLSANTTYWIVVDINDGSEVAYTRDDSFFSDASTQGAVIEVRSAYGNWEAVSWSDDPANLQFEILAGVESTAPVPALSLTGLLLTVATLLLLGAVAIRTRRA